MNEEWTGRNPEEIRSFGNLKRPDRSREKAPACLQTKKMFSFILSFESKLTACGEETQSRCLIQRLCSWNRFSLQAIWTSLINFLNDNFLIFTTRLLETCNFEVDHYVFDRKNNCDLMSVAHRRLPENGSYTWKEGWWFRFNLNSNCLSTLTRRQMSEDKELYRNC